MTRGPVLLLGAVAAFGLWAWLSLAGTVLVVDRSGAVGRAAIVNSAATQPLRRLPGGFFWGVPGLEGSVRIACRDGRAREFGCVTGGEHLWLEVAPGGCPAHVGEMGGPL